MERTAVYEKMNEIFRDIFDDDSITLKDETCAQDIEDWDSFAQVSLVVQIERTFGIKFSVSETTALHNVGDMVDLIQKKLQ